MKTIKSQYISSAYNVIKEDDNGHIMIELDGLYYIVCYRSGQLSSCLPADNPQGGCWVAKLSESGIKYVAAGRSRNAAMGQWKRHIA